jgi:ribonuclease R
VVKRYKKKDPNRSREKKKYGYAAPSREYILEYLTHCKRPVSFEHLRVALNVKSGNIEEAFTFRLKAMLRDGEIHKNRKGSYSAVSQLDLLPGTVIGHRDGYGFVITDTPGPDVFLAQREMCALFSNDRVLIKVMRQRGRPKRLEGEVVDILQRRTRFLVGKLVKDGENYYVQPDSRNCPLDIAIPNNEINQAEPGKYVRVEITRQPSKRRSPLGKVVQELGNKFDSGMEIELAISNYNLRSEWPPEVLQELNTINKNITPSEGRKDCRDIHFITIDGEDARDFDDAVFCEPTSRGGWKLKVAIADVAHYIQTDSALDKEAQSRATSVYFPGRVIPMLPELLSNDLCSLNPNVDRYAMVAEIKVNSKGKVTATDFYNAIIKSKSRYTYNQVDKILKQADNEAQHSVIYDLNKLHQLLLKQRSIRGALEFNTPEPIIIFDDKQKIKNIRIRERLTSHKIIEECMLLANVSVAKYISKIKANCLYRVHETPNLQKIEQLRSVLKLFSIELTGGTEPKTKDFSELLTAISDREDCNFLQKIILRTQQQARYIAENSGHFGLGYDNYTHFTSPIRRYPDLVVHRTLKYILDKQNDCGYHYTKTQVESISEHCSVMERNAEKASREAIDRLKCEFMRDKVGNSYRGTIVEVTNFGIFVEIDAFYIQGLVHITALKNDYYIFDDASLKLIGKNSGVVYQIGGEVIILVDNVNIDQRKIDFSLNDE